MTVNDKAPGNAAAHNERGNRYWAEGRITEAAECYRRALALLPGNPALLVNLGNALARLGQAAQAAQLYEQALASQPDFLDAQAALAAVLSTLGHNQRAVALYEDVERARPDDPGLHVNLGLALFRLGRCAEAIERYDRAIALDPGNYMAHNNRGNALRNQQRLAEAVASFRRALELKPDHVSAHSNLLLTLNYLDTPQAMILEESRRFDAQHAAHLLPAQPAFANSRDPGRVLRVGYVSADLRRHSVAYFLRPVLAAHDRAQLHVTCYASVERPDEVTAGLRALADGWRPIAGVPDEEVVRQVRADGIDILVDLGGHTGGNRLLVFARRAAPVQLSWLGYPNTTGLRAMDYRLTDDIADPPGEADALHVEKLVRLPGGFLCYRPDDAVANLPVQKAATQVGVTFGSFNTLAKVTPEVVRTWAAILARCPGSRLLLKSEALDEAATRERYCALFAQHGIGAERLELLPWIADHRAHMALYQRVDIALDPFPYNGTTTTCEALWMGVPVVALRGSRHAARVGASLLHHAGLPEWVAGSEAGYVDLAATRAGDPAALAALRSKVARRMRCAPLTDVTRFTAELERAYRACWTRWCL